MIQPQEIRRKAERFYPRFLQMWLRGEDPFPWEVRSNKDPGDDHAAAIKAVQQLTEGSRERLGYGYTVERKEINSRRHGRNRFPQRIFFESQEDYLRYIGKQREFDAFSKAVGRVRERYPQLDAWIRSNRKLLIESAGDVEGLLLVVGYLCANPRPGLFARELPLPLDTKFVERNQRVLREWLDRVLPPHAIRADEEHFERRFGLRYAEPHLLVRFLDPQVQRQFASPWAECSIPLHTLAEMNVRPARVLIVENKVNLLTLPMMPHTLGMGALGYGVTELRLINWLQHAQITYWGDVDVDGFKILSHLRKIFPQTKSLLMDRATLQRWRDEIGERVQPKPSEPPPGLTAAERDAFENCTTQGWRIEQEKIPQSQVLTVLGKAMR